MPETITADEVEAELPDNFEAENDGDHCVYVHEVGAPTPENSVGSATIEAVDPELWTAEWCEYSDFSGYHVPRDDVTGAKGRAIAWVAEKAEEASR